MTAPEAHSTATPPTSSRPTWPEQPEPGNARPHHGCRVSTRHRAALRIGRRAPSHEGLRPVGQDADAAHSPGLSGDGADTPATRVSGVGNGDHVSAVGVRRFRCCWPTTLPVQARARCPAPDSRCGGHDAAVAAARRSPPASTARRPPRWSRPPPQRSPAAERPGAPCAAVGAMPACRSRPRHGQSCATWSSPTVCAPMTDNSCSLS